MPIYDKPIRVERIPRPQTGRAILPRTLKLIQRCEEASLRGPGRYRLAYYADPITRASVASSLKNQGYNHPMRKGKIHIRGRDIILAYRVKLLK